MSNPVDPRQPLIDLENKKFRQGTGPNDIGVKVFGAGGSHPLESVTWDSYSIAYNATTDVVTYYQGGLAGTAVLICTITYQTTRKKKSSSVEWSTP